MRSTGANGTFVSSNHTNAVNPVSQEIADTNFLETKIHSSQKNVNTWWGSDKVSMTHVVKNALCFSNDRNGGCTSTFSSLPVVIDDTSWSGFAVDLVSGSARQYSLAM